jgi:hypothetical protein
VRTLQKPSVSGLGAFSAGPAWVRGDFEKLLKSP